MTLTVEQQDFQQAVRDFCARECGTREQRLHEVTMALAGEMIALGGLAPSAVAGRARALAAPV